MKRLLQSGIGRTRTVRRLALVGTVLVGGGGLVALASQASAASGCSVEYNVNQWNTGFTANLTVTNLGKAIDGWKLEFDYAGDQTVTQSWNGVYSQNGKHVTIVNADYNRTISGDGVVNPGIIGTYSGTNVAPASFKLNGVDCNGQAGPISSPTPKPTTRPPSPPVPPSPVPPSPVPPTTSPSPTPDKPKPPNPPPPPGNSGPVTTWPTKKGDAKVDGTVKVPVSLDGGMKRYCCIGSGNQDEGQSPMFELAPNAVLENVIIGAPAGDGVHCKASCTLRNVWWEDVGEDAATLLGSAPAGSVMTVDGGGARQARDKVFQHNGPGTFVIKNFYVDDFGKLIRPCGNCKHGYQGKRDVVLDNIVAKNGHGALAGINENFGDTAKISRITILDDPKHKLTICQRFIGNNTGKEPPKSGSGPDPVHCLYRESDITYK